MTLPPSLTFWPGYLLDFIAEHGTARFGRALTEHGITARHASILVVIDAEGAMSQRALGRRLRIDKSPMVGLVDDLERLGLAERRRGDADRRIQALNLTAAGRTMLGHVERIAAAEQARMFRALDDAERTQLHDLLLRVAESLRD